MNTHVAHAHSFFEQPWWLEATAPGQWDAIEIDEGNRTVARLPFVYKRKFGLRVVGQPQLTQTLGPWIEQTSSHYYRRLSRERELYEQLIRRLPRFDVFAQNFHPNLTNWLPFHWEGFSQTTRYTYTLNDLRDADRLMMGMTKSSRSTIRRAEKKITLVRNGSIADVILLAEKTFRRQGMALPYSPELLFRIDEAAAKHAQRRVLLGVDDDGQVHSAAYVVGDSERAYLLVSGADPELRKSGSGNLVHWEAISAAAEFTKVFDFEGSMIKPVEEFYRGFGAIQTPYHAISKRSRLVGAAMGLRDLMRK